MKNIILITFAFVLSSAAAAQDMPGMKMPKQHSEVKQPPARDKDSKAKAEVTYTCVMHPEIHSVKPGNCPKCGMKLVKEKPRPSAEQKPRGMHRNDDTSKVKPRDNHNMKMEGMDSMAMPVKADLGPIKTIVNNVLPHTITYHLYIRDTIVTFGNKPKRAISVNGQIPMPTLTFTEGDTAEIWVHNELNEVTSMHWHGLFYLIDMTAFPFLRKCLLSHMPHTCINSRSFNMVPTGTTAIPVCRNK